jgi:hypothetical protein
MQSSLYATFALMTSSCVIMGVVFRVIIACLTIPCSYEFILDPLLHELTSQIMINSLRDVSVPWKNNVMLQMFLKASVPVVGKVRLLWAGMRHIQIVVTALCPIAACVKGNKILLEDGSFADRLLFRNRVCDILPTLEIESEEEEDRQELVRCIRSLPESFLRGCTIKWINKTEIWLYMQKQPLCAVVLTADTQWNEGIMKSLREIQAYISSKPIKHKKKFWRIDIRFKDSIVLS